MLLFTVIVLVVALIYFLFLIYWAIIASTKTPSQLTSSNGLWFAVGLDQIPDAIATNYSKLMAWSWDAYSPFRSTRFSMHCT